MVIKSQLGQPITAYSGDEVYWKVPDDLPKMTKLMIDGKALYIHRANFQIIDIRVRTGVVSGLGNTRELIRKIESGEVHYDFVEVMACPGGCVGGGGQPIHDGEERAFERGKNLYYLDRNANLRFSHENPDVIQMYKEYFEAPMSHKAHMLLHTEHKKNM